LSAWQQRRGVDALFDGLMHPGHLSRVTGIEPGLDVLNINGGQRRRVGDADNTEAEFEGFLTYLFRKLHNFYLKIPGVSVLYHF